MCVCVCEREREGGSPMCVGLGGRVRERDVYFGIRIQRTFFFGGLM